MTTTYTVYTLTPKGSFSQKYEGTNEEAALKVYNKLTDANKPRVLNKKDGHIAKMVMTGGGFPE